MTRKAKRRGISLLFADVEPAFEMELRRGHVLRPDEHFFGHIDEALEV